jgi:drug/metabolite transporter (DMT)-like permease
MNLPKTEEIKVAASPQFEGHYKSTPESHGYLSAPLTGPIRPLSPDALSILSSDEYDQIQPNQQGHYEDYDPASTHVVRPKGWRPTMTDFWTRNYGLFLMLLAQFFGTCMNVLTRLLEVEGNKGQGLHPFQILFARMGITVVLASLYMYYTKTPHFPFGLPEVRWLLVARGFGGFFGVTGMYWSLMYLPLSDATVITFLAPGLACWACSFLINEPFTRTEKLGTFVSLVGVVFIARPTTFFQAFGNTPPASGAGDMVPLGNTTVSPEGKAPDAGDYDSVTPAQRLAAVGIALVGVVGTVCAITTIRWIGKRAHPLISVNYFAVWCTFVSLIMQFVLPGVGFLLPADLKEWTYLIFLGIAGFVMVCVLPPLGQMLTDA